MLLEIPPILFIDENEVDGVPYLQSIVDVFIARGQWHSGKVQSNGYYLTLGWTPIHCFEFYESLLLGFGDLAGSEGLPTLDADIHALNLQLD